MKKFRTITTALAKFSPRASTRDRIRQVAAVLTGISMIGLGLWMIYRPLAPIFLGIVLIVEVLTSKGGAE